MVTVCTGWIGDRGNLCWHHVTYPLVFVPGRFVPVVGLVNRHLVRCCRFASDLAVVCIRNHHRNLDHRDVRLV